MRRGFGWVSSLSSAGRGWVERNPPPRGTTFHSRARMGREERNPPPRRSNPPPHPPPLPCRRHRHDRHHNQRHALPAPREDRLDDVALRGGVVVHVVPLAP